MKKLLFIMTVLAAGAMTGCNPTGGSSSFTDYYKISTEETTGGIITLTEYKHDAMANVIEETQTRGGMPVYIIEDYETDYSKGTLTSYRTTYNDDGTETRHKLVSTFQYNREIKYEEFLMTGPDTYETVASKRMETEYDEQGRRKNFKEYEGGVEVLSRSDFRYDYNSYHYGYKESKNGGEPVEMFYEVTDMLGQTIVGHKLWYGYVDTSEKGTLIEELRDYEETGMKATYSYDRWDSEGVKTTTNVEDMYREITVTINN